MESKPHFGPTSFRLVSPIQMPVENPTPADIAKVVDALPYVSPEVIAEHADFLILTKVGEGYVDDDCCYMQARPHRSPKYEGMYLMEFYVGEKKRHYMGYSETEHVAAVFESYLRENDEWKEMLVWRDVSSQFKHLLPYLPPEEFAESYFGKAEWQTMLKEKKKHDERFWKDLGDEEKAP